MHLKPNCGSRLPLHSAQNLRHSLVMSSNALQFTCVRSNTDNLDTDLNAAAVLTAPPTSPLIDNHMQ